MARDEPFVCDICGADVSGSHPFFTAEFTEFGIADVRGRFCSMLAAASGIAEQLHPEFDGADLRGRRRCAAG